MAPRRATHLSERPPDSSEEEEELHGKPEPGKQGEPGALRFDKHHVISSVRKVQSTMPSLLSDEDVASWTEWLESTPAALEDVHARDRALPIKMPMKCSAARPPAAVAPPPPREQKELISYKNPEGGRGAPPTLASTHPRIHPPRPHCPTHHGPAPTAAAYGDGQLKREALQLKPLTESDVPVGSTVAIRRHPSDPWDPPGYGTHFYIGDVIEVHCAVCEAAGGSSSAAERRVASIEVHYRLPMVGTTKACNDEHKGWLPACCALHPFTGQCERRNSCVGSRPLGKDTSRLSARVEADTIFETKVELTSTSMLKAETKRRIMQGAAPEEQETWRARMHITAGAAEAEARGEQPRKQRPRKR